MRKNEFKKLLKFQLNNSLYNKRLEATAESMKQYIESLTEIVCNYIKLSNVYCLNDSVCIDKNPCFNNWYIEGKINLMITFYNGSFFNGDFNLHLVQKESE